MFTSVIYLRLFLSCPAMCQCIMRVFHFLLTFLSNSKCNVLAVVGTGISRRQNDIEFEDCIALVSINVGNVPIDRFLLQ